jgi:hypothetical protein
MRSNALRRFPENNQLLRIRVRQRTKQDSADNREDRSVGAYSESEGEDGDGGEAGIFAEHAGAVAQILEAENRARRRRGLRVLVLLLARCHLVRGERFVALRRRPYLGAFFLAPEGRRTNGLRRRGHDRCRWLARIFRKKFFIRESVGIGSAPC